MLKIKLLIATLAMVATSSFAQKLTQQDVNAVNNEVYQSLVKENSLIMKRQTKEGEVASCDFEYQYAYRDFNAKQGTVVLVQGAFAYMYFKGKYPSFMVKVQPYVADINDAKNKWKIVMPPYVDVILNGESLKKYQVGEFPCENGGACKAYSDKDGSLTKILFNQKNLDVEIKFSLTKGGIDNSLLFSKLIPKNKFIGESDKFMACSTEIVNRIGKDLEQLGKGK